MSEVARLHHTGLTVASLDASLAFYRDLLGFEVLAEQEKAGGYLAEIVGYPEAHVRMAHIALPGSDERLELFEYLSPAMVSEPSEPRRIGLTHVCLLVDDLAALYRRLLDAGVTSFFSPPVEVDTGVNRGGLGVYLRDPDGTIVELFQPPRR